MDEVAARPGPLPHKLRRDCRYGVVSLMLGRFAVIDRRSGTVVEAGFRSFEQGWVWVAERVKHDFQ
jgi:hypothetical protein